MAKLTIKEAVALFVWRNPNCRGYEIQAAYFHNRFGRMPVTRQEKSLNGSMTSSRCGGGLCVNSREDACNGTRHEDRILIKDYHGCDCRFSWGNGNTIPKYGPLVRRYRLCDGLHGSV